MSMDKFKEQVLRVGQQASFAVQMKGKKGSISASVNSPSGQNIECSVAELEEGRLLFSIFGICLYWLSYLNVHSQKRLIKINRCEYISGTKSNLNLKNFQYS